MFFFFEQKNAYVRSNIVVKFHQDPIQLAFQGFHCDNHWHLDHLNIPSHNVLAFLVRRITFLTAEACLIGGSVRNAYHTKYLGYYMKHDLVTCATLRKGVFAAAAALMLINLLASLMYYWSYSRAATGGFIKHQNEVGMSMTDYGLDKGGSMP